MTRRPLYWTVHYFLLSLYVLFALFPLYWLLKVALTRTRCSTAKAFDCGHRTQALNISALCSHIAIFRSFSATA